MACTYVDDPNSTGTAAQKRDAVRLLTQDTDTNNQLFTDAEVAWAIADHNNVYLSAAALADIAVGANRGVSSKGVGRTRIAYLKNRAPLWRSRGLMHQKPFAGGISVADQQVLQDDSDWPRRDFERGMHDRDDTDDSASALEQRD